MDCVAIDLYIEEAIQFGGLQNGGAVLARSDDGNFEPVIAKLTEEFDASFVRFEPFFLVDPVDEVVLAVAEPAHCFRLRGVVGAPLGESDTARCEKVANPVEARLPIDIEPVVRRDLEGTKSFAFLRCTLLQ